MSGRRKIAIIVDLFRNRIESRAIHPNFTTGCAKKTTKITTKSSVVSNCGETETYLLKSTNKLFVCLYLAHFKILTGLTLSFHLY